MTLLQILIVFQLASHAQDNPSLEILEVKGTKERKAYVDTPESISILNSHDLATTGRLNDIDVLNGLGNVQVNNNNESFSVRGINSTGVTGFQKDNLASVLIDGMFQTELATKAGSFNMWDMDRIEVLRGAQSTNMGINSLAGSILLYHQKPQFVHEGSARATLGNFGHKEAALMVNTPLIENRVSTRVTYEKEVNDGYITNMTSSNSKWGQRDRDRISGDVLFELTEDIRILFNAKYNRNQQGGTYTQGTRPLDDQVQEDVDLKNNTENQQYSAQVIREFSAHWSKEFFAGFSKSKQAGVSDADGTPQNTGGTRTESRRDHFFTLENRIYYKTDRLTNMIGLHSHDFRLDDSTAFNLLFPVTGTPVAVSQDSLRTRKVYAIFDTLTYNFDDFNSLTLGVRGELAESIFGADLHGRRLQDAGPGGNAMIDGFISQLEGSRFGSQRTFVFLPKLSYLLGPKNSKWGVSYTRGYRTAGVSINRQRGLAVQYDPEYTDNYELSYKYVKNNFRIGANLYYIDWRYQQVLVQLSNQYYDNQVENAARSNLFGGEVDTTINLTHSQELGASVGYTQTKFNEFQTSAFNFQGKQFPYAPHWTSRISHSWMIVQDLRLFTIVRYLTDSFGNAENTRRSDEQFYVNMNLSYALGSWMMNLYGNNIFDKRFLIYNGYPIDAGSPYQTAYHQTNAPREFGLQVTYSW